VPKYKIADVVFEVKPIYRYTVNLCKAYEYTGEEAPKFVAQMTEQDILAEQQKTDEKYPPAYFESLAVFRKLLDYSLAHCDGIVFHSSAIMVDGNAYLFTAPSGTGKSTHTRLWREMLGDKAVMINDDKPMVRFIDGDFYVYGTPWNGKHNLDTNTRAKVKAICKISQSKENSIRRANSAEMLLTILNQTIRPTETVGMDKLLNLIEKLLTSVDLYCLGCNISREAAELSYKTMSGEQL